MPKTTARFQKGFALIAAFSRKKKADMSSGRNYGFTLIELLIVISVIGILAVAVVTVTNPLEQIRKGTDIDKRADSKALVEASERFFATFNCYPWNYNTSCTGVVVLPTTQVSTMKTGAAGTVANSLTVLSTTANEIKPQYLNQSSLTYLYATEDTNNQLHVCFQPDSRSFRASARLQRDGQTACVAGTFNGTATSCHACVPE